MTFYGDYHGTSHKRVITVFGMSKVGRQAWDYLPKGTPSSTPQKLALLMLSWGEKITKRNTLPKILLNVYFHKMKGNKFIAKLVYS